MRTCFPGIAAATVVKDVSGLYPVHLERPDGVQDITPAGIEFVSEGFDMEVINHEHAEVSKALNHALGVAVQRCVLKDVVLERVGQAEVGVRRANLGLQDPGIERVSDLVKEHLHLPVVIPDGRKAAGSACSTRLSPLK